MLSDGSDHAEAFLNLFNSPETLPTRLSPSPGPFPKKKSTRVSGKDADGTRVDIDLASSQGTHDSDGSDLPSLEELFRKVTGKDSSAASRKSSSRKARRSDQHSRAKHADTSKKDGSRVRSSTSHNTAPAETEARAPVSKFFNPGKRQSSSLLPSSHKPNEAGTKSAVATPSPELLLGTPRNVSCRSSSSRASLFSSADHDQPSSSTSISSHTSYKARSKRVLVAASDSEPDDVLKSATNRVAAPAAPDLPPVSKDLPLPSLDGNNHNPDPPYPDYSDDNDFFFQNAFDDDPWSTFKPTKSGFFNI
jgi:hypothetical protein